MLHAITEWMNGDYAGTTMLVMRMLFFVLFIVTSLLVCFRLPPLSAKGGKGSSYLFPVVFFVVAIVGIFVYQCKWQLLGTRNIDFVRFMRRHNHRESVDIRRGSILDRNGSIFAADDTSIRTAGHRSYPLGPAAAHVIGYYDPLFGITGIEKAADVALTGIGASVGEELGRLGRSIIDSKPVEGGDVKLTLDARLQRTCYRLLGDHRGAIVAMNPSNGEILALASAPSFDPLNPGGFYGDAEDAPFLNRAVQGRYPAGSTFKVVMSAISADMGKSWTFDCPASGFRAAADAQPIRDSEYYSYRRSGAVWQGFGKLGLKDALVHSSNVYFAQLAQKIPASVFNSYVDRLGITIQQVIFVAGDGDVKMLPGSIPAVTDSDRKMRSQLAIGQGKMAVSPLHVAMWTSAIAADGLVYPPHLDFARSAEDLKPTRVFTAATASNVRYAMREVVKRGTGKGADASNVGLCGKTGTAQAPGGADHSWFTCFTTETTPRLVVTVLVERGGYGSKTAMPIARKVVEEALALGVVRKK